VHVADLGLDHTDAGRLRVRGRGQADPRALGQSVQVQRQLGVDEAVAREVEDEADAVDRVGDDQRVL
jgi:hypothetical protein